LLDLATSGAIFQLYMRRKLASVSICLKNHCATALHEIECEAFYE
jgi:hypothetical protein